MASHEQPTVTAAPGSYPPRRIGVEPHAAEAAARYESSSVQVLAAGSRNLLRSFPRPRVQIGPVS